MARIAIVKAALLRILYFEESKVLLPFDSLSSSGTACLSAVSTRPGIGLTRRGGTLMYVEWGAGGGVMEPLTYRRAAGGRPGSIRGE